MNIPFNTPRQLNVSQAKEQILMPTEEPTMQSVGPKIAFWHPTYFSVKNPEAQDLSKQCVQSRATIAYAFDPKLNALLFSYAFCSHKDRFCRRTGRQIATSRNPHLIYVRQSLTPYEQRQLIARTIVDNSDVLFAIPNGLFDIK